MAWAVYLKLMLLTSLPVAFGLSYTLRRACRYYWRSTPPLRCQRRCEWITIVTAGLLNFTCQQMTNNGDVTGWDIVGVVIVSMFHYLVMWNWVYYHAFFKP